MHSEHSKKHLSSKWINDYLTPCCLDGVHSSATTVNALMNILLHEVFTSFEFLLVITLIKKTYKNRSCIFLFTLFFHSFIDFSNI